MSLDTETIRILQEDAAFRAKFTPVEDLRQTHGLNQQQAEEFVDLAQRMNDLNEQIERLEEIEARLRNAPVNWKKEGF